MTYGMCPDRSRGGVAVGSGTRSRWAVPLTSLCLTMSCGGEDTGAPDTAAQDGTATDVMVGDTVPTGPVDDGVADVASGTDSGGPPQDVETRDDATQDLSDDTTASADTSREDATPDAGLPVCTASAWTEQRDLRYHTVAGVDPNLLSLDIYRPVLDAGCPPAPIAIWVHGGGWAVGDKANQMEHKAPWFTSRGFVLVSVNYRLSPFPYDFESTDAVRYPTHNEDVARAITWIVARAETGGADPERVVLLGHSAGAAIASTLATDERFLEAEGLSLAALRCAVSVDTELYDLTDAIGAGDGQEDMIRNAIGDDTRLWEDASPMSHVEAGKGIPAFFIVTRGLAPRRESARAFATALVDAGVTATVLDARPLTHEGVNAAIGDSSDALVTPALGTFLDDCLQ